MKSYGTKFQKISREKLLLFFLPNGAIMVGNRHKIYFLSEKLYFLQLLYTCTAFKAKKQVLATIFKKIEFWGSFPLKGESTSKSHFWKILLYKPIWYKISCRFHFWASNCSTGYTFQDTSILTHLGQPNIFFKMHLFLFFIPLFSFFYPLKVAISF